MKIIHLSDLHLGRYWFNKTEERFNRIIEHLKSDAFDGSEFLIITGDLIESAGREGSMQRAREIIKPLEEKFKNLLICPGNHDYGNFWGGSPEYMKPFFKIFADSMTSNTAVPDHADAGERPYNSPFPVLNTFGDHLLIGLDTTEGEFKDEINRKWCKWDWGAEGELGCRQLAALNAILNDNELSKMKVIIYLHHHPYKNMLIKNKFRDADAFNETIKDKANLILFGHNHKSANMEAEARNNGVDMALEGGSIIGKGDIKFRVLDFSGEKPTFDEITIAV